MIERDILIETYDDYTGQLDFTRVQGHPETWYLDSKQSLSVWEVSRNDGKTAYESIYDKQTKKGAQRCKVWRWIDNYGSGLELKYGSTYTADVGYKVYEKSTSKVPREEGTGRPIEITWMAASSLLIAQATSAILLFLLF